MLHERTFASQDALKQGFPATPIVKREGEIPAPLQTALSEDMLVIPVNESYCRVYSPKDDQPTPSCYVTSLKSQSCGCADFRYRRVHDNERCKHHWRILAEVLQNRIAPQTVNPFEWLTMACQKQREHLANCEQTPIVKELDAELSTLLDEIGPPYPKTTKGVYIRWFILRSLLRDHSLLWTEEGE